MDLKHAFVVTAVYLGGKLDRALEDWLGLFVIILALMAATWFGVGAEFHDWLKETNPANR